MFPIRDNIPSRTFPGVNYGLIACCALVFFLQLAEGENEATLSERFGMIPVRVVHPDRPVMIPDIELVRTPRGIEQVKKMRPAAPAGVPAWLTPLTCIFLHGGWLHILGNLWFLHIFGDNVEDRFGHGLYLFFYLASGVGASLAHLLADPTSPIPTIGASGAIAGVMGAYFVFYPAAQVHSIIPIGPFIQSAILPAPLFLGVWFVIQVVQGAMSSTETAGVAWWAHIGGFAVGAGGALLMKAIHVASPPVAERISNGDQGRFYRTPVRIRRDPPR